MKITVINNNPSGSFPIPCVDGSSCAAGATKVMTGRSKEDVIYMMSKSDGNLVIIRVDIEASDRAPIVCDMKNPADPAADVLELAGCGFDLETESGTAANVAPQMYLGAFDDAACTVPSVDGKLGTATTGTIDSGSGTNLVKVTPSAAGIVALKLTVTGAGVIYLKAWPVGTSYIVDSSDTDTVTFTET